MEKEQVIKIARALGFKVEDDTWDGYGEYILFKLDNDELDERGFSWVWHKDKSIEENMVDAGVILFRAGQKMLRINMFKYIDL
jgi:hypothetical protein